MVTAIEKPPSIDEVLFVVGTVMYAIIANSQIVGTESMRYENATANFRSLLD